MYLLILNQYNSNSNLKDESISIIGQFEDYSVAIENFENKEEELTNSLSWTNQYSKDYANGHRHSSFFLANKSFILKRQIIKRYDLLLKEVNSSFNF